MLIARLHRNKRMVTKVAVVTGANKGLGFGLVRGLCKRFDGVVYLTSRDEKRGQDAVAALNKEGLHPKYHQLDITDNASIIAFRDHIKEKYGYIDILINNAAIAFLHEAPEPLIFQAERTLFVNYFSFLASCEILFPLLRDGARVVNMSTRDAHLSRIPSPELKKRLQDPNLTVPELTEMMNQFVEAVRAGTNAPYWGNSTYTIAKAGVTALTKIQQRMLNDRDIKVNAVHPGFVDTDMTAHRGPMTVEDGVEAPLYLALDAPDSIRGEFVWYNKEVIDWDGERPIEDY